MFVFLKVMWYGLTLLLYCVGMFWCDQRSECLYFFCHVGTAICGNIAMHIVMVPDLSNIYYKFSIIQPG